MTHFPTTEAATSQLCAVKLLVSLGYTYISPKKSLSQRKNKYANVLLENILTEQLHKLNCIHYKKKEYAFSNENITCAVERLKEIHVDGLITTNEQIYDMLILGTTLEQTIEKDKKSFFLKYIDWEHPKRNAFHVTVEYTVEGTQKTRRVDVVLFVNGIPFGIIECKSFSHKAKEGVDQIKAYEHDITRLFLYSQLLLATNKNNVLYGTVGTKPNFWTTWQEEFTAQETNILKKLVSNPLSLPVQQTLLQDLRLKSDDTGAKRLPTQQDKALYTLCRPDRLLELTQRFTVFEDNSSVQKKDKKLSRYNQYFVVKGIMERIHERNHDGSRKSGVIWQSQGSGKTLSMVMLVRSLLLDENIRTPRIVLVTDRVDLDKQLKATFAACNLNIAPIRASSGKHLFDLLVRQDTTLVTTLVHKFNIGAQAQIKNPSPDIFVLVDECHRTQFGNFAASMRSLLPGACYLGFTGTPIYKKDKNNFQTFGPLIQPVYSIEQAVADKTVLPLLYEGRLVDIEQNKNAVDLWFDRATKGLTEKEKQDLRHKYSRDDKLNKAEQIVEMRAFDINENYLKNWKGTGFKAQLVAPDKATAIAYYRFLEKFNEVTSAVLISGPETITWEEEKTGNDPVGTVQHFWDEMMHLYGNEEQYNEALIHKFKNTDELEIIIVVSKLLTGFDAPENTVLYLCRKLSGHTLLQAIARVNRLCEGKDYGHVLDYAGILGRLDKALTEYEELAEFEEKDIKQALIATARETDKLSQLHFALWDVFKEISQTDYTKDAEAYERFLKDRATRDVFYQRLTAYSRCLTIALASAGFLNETDENIIDKYKKDAKMFHELRAAVRIRYGEAVHYADYEPRIKNLLDKHIQAGEVIRLCESVDIFDNERFAELKKRQGITDDKAVTTAQADAIASDTARTIEEKMAEDPALYKKFSEMIQDAIKAFKEKRLQEQMYLDKVKTIRKDVDTKKREDVPLQLQDNGDALASYGVLKDLLMKWETEKADVIAVDIARAVDEILKKHSKVNFWNDHGARMQAINEVEDYLYDEVPVDFSAEQLDAVLESMLRLAEARHAAKR